MGYLYKPMNRTKKAIRTYYEEKENERFGKQQLIGEQWNNTHYRLIHVARIYLNPTFPYSSFKFGVEVMDEFFIYLRKKGVDSTRMCKIFQTNGDT